MQITTEQQVVATIRPLTAAGHGAQVQNPRWESDNTGVSITVAEGGLSAILTPDTTSGQELPYTAQITVTADADLGEGVREIQAVGALTIVSPEATTLAIEFGEPTTIPPAG